MKTDDGDRAPAGWSPDRACMAGGSPDSPVGRQPEVASVFGPAAGSMEELCVWGRGRDWKGRAAPPEEIRSKREPGSIPWTMGPFLTDRGCPRIF